VFLPGAAEVGGQGPGEQELGVRGHEDPDPAAGLFGGSHLGGGQPESSLQELEGMLDADTGEAGAPELVR
jgi:hypothetical protein